ncbi:MAG: glutamate-5-semialdehyde dehydrogenase [Oscillospiraceae bacterium]|jgi:glutamate-5-semialdehyde dehydrogenase|nr:glutamate-5-semialdehyde dehydrogenase [Oscillospiraceae bacterium]
MTIIEQMGKNAKVAAAQLLTAGAAKNTALNAIANALEDNAQAIIDANALDIAAGQTAGLTQSLIDRLTLNTERVKAMANGMREVAALPDPVGTTISGSVLQNGLQITKVRVPLGVIGIIYEARPNVTADAAALCLKAGNAVILRGGKEAINSNKAIAVVMRNALQTVGLNPDCIQLIEDTSRQSSTELMGLSEYLDVLIPRGGAGLINAVVQNAKVPVIETGVGNCHAFVDASADLQMAVDIIFNAKTSRPSVCNALETMLVHKNIAPQALPQIYKKLKDKAVELRVCPRAFEIIGGEQDVKLATDEDFYTEFLDYILAVRVVDDLDQAIEHIAKYSSGHSEVIITQDYKNAEQFLQRVDSAAVYVNASTRFTDGGEFGMGAEIGISTQKLHARGPMGLEQLTSMKFVVRGNGQVR